MKVLILTEGGRTIGLGHLMRCQALAREFRDARRRVIVNFIAHADSQTEVFFKRTGGSLINFDWIKDTRRTLDLAKDADLVIIDSYIAPPAVYSRIHSLNNKAYVAAIDDYNRINYKADMVINPSLCRRSDLGYNSRSLGYLLGSEFVILRKEFRFLPQRKINNTVKRILIAFGGGNYRSLISRILSSLSGKGYNFDIVSSDCPKISERRRSGIKFHSGLSALQMRRLMADCDLCISAGGQTLYELAATGTPVVAVAVAKNQMLNVRNLSLLGILKYAGWYEDKDLVREIIGSIDLMRDAGIRRKMSRLGQMHIDGNGAKKIVSYLYDIYKRGVKHGCS